MALDNLLHHIVPAITQNVPEIHLQVLLRQCPALLPLVGALHIEHHLGLLEVNLVGKLPGCVECSQIHLDRAARITQLGGLGVELGDTLVNANILGENSGEGVHCAMISRDKESIRFKQGYVRSDRDRESSKTSQQR